MKKSEKMKYKHKVHTNTKKKHKDNETVFLEILYHDWVPPF